MPARPQIYRIVGSRASSERTSGVDLLIIDERVNFRKIRFSLCLLTFGKTFQTNDKNEE